MQEFSNCVRFTVKVKPHSPETKLINEPDGTITLLVVAPPERGRANREIVNWFSKKLKISPSHVRLVSGIRSKTKIVEVLNINKYEVTKALGIT